MVVKPTTKHQKGLNRGGKLGTWGQPNKDKENTEQINTSFTKLTVSRTNLDNPGSTSNLANSMLSLVHLQLETYTPYSQSTLNIQQRIQDEALESGGQPEYVTDTGYSWVILVSCFIMFMLSQIPVATAGIFYAEFLESFHSDERITLWACSLGTSLTYIIGPLIAIIVERIGSRPTAMIGCGGLGLSLCTMSFTTNFTTFFIAYGILASIFVSFIYVTAAMGALNHFKKYRQIASVAISSGGPLSYFIIPPIIAQFLKEQGWREANLFCGLLCLQGVVLAALLRPPKVKHAPDQSTEAKFTENSTCEESNTKGNEIIHTIEINNNNNNNDYNINNNQTDYTDDEKLTVTPCEGDILITVENQTTEDTEQGSKLNNLKSRWLPLLHWRMILILELGGMFGWGLSTFYVSMPNHVRKYGYTPEDISVLLMISAIVNIIVRLGVVVLGRFVDYDKVVAFVIGLLTWFGSFMCFAFFSTYAWFAVASVLFGIGASIMAGLLTPLILEIHGEHRVELVFGICNMFGGVAILVAPSAADTLCNLSGSEITGFLVSAGIGVAIIASLIPHIILKLCRREHQ